jgi:hypothetical protein
MSGSIARKIVKNIMLSAALVACISFSTGSLAAATASTTAAAPAREARVATGAHVPLVPSARTAEEWSAKRPNFRALRPKARGNLD